LIIRDDNSATNLQEATQVQSICTLRLSIVKSERRVYSLELK